MGERLFNLQLGAMLHDFGKIVRRAKPSEVDNDKHQFVGEDYLKKVVPELLEIDEISSIIKYHHKNDLKNANLPPDSLAYIVYEADNIASGIDRVDLEKGKYGNEMDLLESIFNSLNSHKNDIKKRFFIRKVDESEFNMPRNYAKNDVAKVDSSKSIVKSNPSSQDSSAILKASSSDYGQILNIIKENLIKDKEKISLDRMLNLLEATTQYFSSSSYTTVADVSFFDHVKLTSAISACLYLWEKEKSNKNFYKEYFSSDQEKIKNSRKTDKFIMLTGEFSGIQDFIYTISSKKAMKNLRGRSFYLEILTEHIIDEILSCLELSRANLLYTGGSKFYLILPNIQEVAEIAERIKEKVSDFLIETTGATLYFELEYTTTSADEMANGMNDKTDTENRIGDIFRRISHKISKAKLQRYSERQLSELFDQDSSVNDIGESRECIICKKSSVDIENNDGICGDCNSFIWLGDQISRRYHHNRDSYFLISKSNDLTKVDDKYSRKYITLPSLKEQRVFLLIANDRKSLNLLKNTNDVIRLYSINSFSIGENLAKNIWIGNYNRKNEKNEYSLIEFESLAKMANGIDRLAVIRADIDNLGAAFQSGFKTNNKDNPYKYMTLSKSAVLSRYLSDFFKRKINLILDRDINAVTDNDLFTSYCNILTDSGNEPRNIVLVYSGGDDLFAIGAWDDIVEFSVDLKTAFKDFTGDKLTLSAGIGFFNHHYPVYNMANQTGILEENAKTMTVNGEDMPKKDAVSLFGKVDDEDEYLTTFSWDDFIDNVLEEKYKFLRNTTTINQEEKSPKVFLGRGKLYEIMNLLKNQHKENNGNSDSERLDIARFAYTLARIEHNDYNENNYNLLKSQLFKWMQDDKDVKELLTAIMLVIYRLRGE